jgi:hypothetical protein
MLKRTTGVGREYLLLYSTNTWLAYKISKEYYGDVHYVWCSPYFSFKSLTSHDVANPPSSSPGEIYDRLFEDVRYGELHSAKIDANRVGLINGANKKAAAGVITTQQKREIHSIVKRAERSSFRPLLYIIPFALVTDLIVNVPVKSRAHPLANEFIIEMLPRRYFDVIEYRYY